MTQRIILFLSGILFFSCSDDPTSTKKTSDHEQAEVQAPLFEQIDPVAAGIGFQNIIVEDEEVNHLMWDAAYYGGGVAVGDVNNDGLQDIFFCGNQVNDGLYINKGGFEFEDVSQSSGITEHAGWSNGAAIVDVNGDGLRDIYVCRTGWLSDNEQVDERRNKLFINQGNLIFVEESGTYGLDNEGYSTQSAWLDYDKDGDLDMFLLNAPSNNIPQKVEYNNIGFPPFASDKLFRNDGGSFTDVSDEAGVSAFSYGLGVIASDLNHDGLTDIYVANDYERPDYMYINQGDGSFSNEINQKIKHTCYTAMGVDAADINNDCLVDIAVLDMQSEDHVRSKTNMPTMNPDQFWSWVDQGYNYQYMTNVLQINHGAGYFSDIAQLAGVASTDWSWSVLLADYDMDGWQDMYVTNGINRDIRNNDFALDFEEKMANKEAIDLFEFASEAPSNRIPNYMFRNGGSLEFEKITGDWGLDEPSFSFGAAHADLDNDGDLDLVVNNNNMAPFLYRNTNGSSNNYLNVSIEGGQGNLDGLGSKAVVFYGEDKAYREITNVKGYQSSSQPIAHFGLGNVSKVDSVVIFFSDGTNAKAFNVDANATVSFSKSDSKVMGYDVYGAMPRYFQDITQQVGIDYSHVENEFDDFEIEILLPHRESRNGPSVAVGDVNGDGIEDFFIGGAAGSPGELMIQNSQGQFSSLAGPWQADAAFEDLGAVFLDIDGDGDLDLFVASGGNHLDRGSDGYANRLYLNQDGSFMKTPLDGGVSNSSVVIAGDVDGDNDLDLFVGGHCLPRAYPDSDASALLINEGGQLVDRTAEFAPDLLNVGLVNDAVFSDYDGDGDEDLLVIGEWMSPTFFVNDAGKLSPSSENASLAHLTGWWFSADATDLDGDGDLDYVLGNIGINNKFLPSQEKPLLVYGNDFDNNETNDIILAKNSKGKYVPVRGRECSSEQVPFVKEKYPDFEGFANAELEDIYGEGLETAIKFDVREFHSGVLMNNSGSFEFIPFPNMAQIAPIMGAIASDYNKDGIMDVVVAGNHFDAEVETTRHDSGNGLLLLGKGGGTFEAVDLLYSGFYAPTNVKCLESIELAAPGKSAILVGSSANRLVAFSYVR